MLGMAKNWDFTMLSTSNNCQMKLDNISEHSKKISSKIDF